MMYLVQFFPNSDSPLIVERLKSAEKYSMGYVIVLQQGTRWVSTSYK